MQMSSNCPQPTAEEFIKYVSKFPQKHDIKHSMERAFAITAGWKDADYSYLYRKYILSTQREIGDKGQTGKEKGDALEELARYFLKHGGFTKDIRDINASGKWQVDGQGIINKSAMQPLWGEEINNKIGYQVYLECKNHSEPMKKNDFNDHCCKMDDHECNVGIVASTSGFKITGGNGIAERVHVNIFKNKFYLLLSIRDFDLAYAKKVPPIALIIESLERTTNDLYRTDSAVEKQYTKPYCKKMAKDKYDELFNSNEV
ncbi:MAG: hypothetical protein GY710_09440 [Desulfobacteraceae bacterium]|nr:hypothetical protein [Desulfobacteraceae bacterium]